MLNMNIDSMPTHDINSFLILVLEVNLRTAYALGISRRISYVIHEKHLTFKRGRFRENEIVVSC